MFEELRERHRIFVIGPQRSGTRICAKMAEKRSSGTGPWLTASESSCPSTYSIAL